jgi:hypothetical protein
MNFSRQQRRNQTSQRWVSILLLLTFLTSHFPIPVANSQSYLSGIPFPCRGGKCGCSSAAQCWTSCCCLSPSERKAWAKKHGITPPRFAILDESISADVKSDSSYLSRSNSKSDSCCSTIAVKKQESEGSASCCSGKFALKDATQDDSKSCCRDEAETHAVLVMLAVKCRGASPSFTMLPWFNFSLANARCVMLEADESLLPPFDERAASLIWDLRTPPPRSAC